MVNLEDLKKGTELVKKGFAQMQKGGVILDVTSPEEAKIAEEAGAVAVMALEKVPADIRDKGGVARMADPAIVEEIMDAVTIPVMAKCRIGHTVEAQILEATGVDMVDESEVLTPADKSYHVEKKEFEIPFVCGARDLGEALRRIDEGAAMIRTKGEAGTGNIVEAVKHMRAVQGKIRELEGKEDEELKKVAREIEAPYEQVKECAERQRLPVVNFAAGGVAGPADAALMMQMGADGVFVGSGVFKSENPEERGKAIVKAVNNYDDPNKLKEIAKNLGKPMSGLDVENMSEEEKIQGRGW
ncbi:MAG: Pyridoxine biosynthesis enzyme SNZ1 [Candidatus Methanohalarchaeum thermophilum]|uniref:Pyridoxal 5'-phosphate synthase subunit PdxS n=1 Tax=Methanohalarchaeum thermophilum TaxID=1903181 RepID=A0A1Q6DUW9_METT1|nr:MAG: Pyridoxine biosynthesis enzyme SNZ1 [Candidatus Methanohalarchaeum thermophilum]